MKQTFKLKKGEILFDNDTIFIKDDAKKQRRLALLSSSMWAIYGTISVLRYFKTGDKFLLWSGLFIGIAHWFVFISNLSQVTKSEIPFEDIGSLKVKQRFGNKFLDIKLKNSCLRRVILADDETEMEDYIETNFIAT